MINKIGIEFNNNIKFNNNNSLKNNKENFRLINKFSTDTFSFTGNDAQKQKLDNILLNADASAKNYLKELWVQAQHDKYNSITPLHVFKSSLKDCYDYVENLDGGESFDPSKMPDLALVLAEDLNYSIFSKKELRKKIKPILVNAMSVADSLIKEGRPQNFDNNKKMNISDELIDYVWSYRDDKSDSISTNTFLEAILSEDDESVSSFYVDMVHDISNAIMQKTTPLKDRKPFTGYEEKARNVLKNLLLGTNMFITFDHTKEEPYSFLDTVNKLHKQSGDPNTNIIELNSYLNDDYLSSIIDGAKQDKKHKFIIALNPSQLIAQTKDEQGNISIPPGLVNAIYNQPSNVKYLFYDARDNYYNFQETGLYNSFQETAIPVLSSEQMVKYFKENPSVMKEIKIPFSKSAVEKVITASSKLDGVFPEKTIELMKKISSYNINSKKEISAKDVMNYLEEAVDLFRKTNENSSVEVIFDTGKHISQMAGRSSTKKEAELLIKQIKSKKLGTKGVLIYSQDGYPGGGRKFTAKAIAGDAKVPYIEVNTMDFGTKDVEIFGSALSPEASIKKLFSLVKTQAEANPNKGAVLFIENFEYFSVGEMLSFYHQKAMAQLLREMEKAEKEGLNILVAGSVSNPDLIGEAMMKSFKFVDSIEVATTALNPEDREKILIQAFKEHKVKIDKDEQAAIIKFASEITDGFPFIHLKNLVKKSKSVAQERGHKFLTKGDITEAYLQLTTGRPSAGKVRQHEKMIATSHECGHATNLEVMNSIARKYGQKWHIPQKVNFVTLDPRGFYAGAVYHGKDINSEVSFESAFADLVCSFGGNSAEKYFFGMDGSWGITADMDHVRRLSSAMVKKMGFGAKTGKMNVSSGDNLSDNMKQIVENDQRVIVNNAQITSELITEMYSDFNKWFTEKYSPLVGTGDCIVDGDEFRRALNLWRQKQSPAKRRELELCDNTILKIIDATKKGIAVTKE